MYTDLHKPKEDIVISSQERENIPIVIDEADIPHIISMYLENTYSDVLLALVRENVCNAIDSHYSVHKYDTAIEITHLDEVISETIIYKLVILESDD